VAEHPLIGDPPVGTPEHQHLHELLEDHPVWDAPTVAAKWMACCLSMALYIPPGIYASWDLCLLGFSEAPELPKR
jgi:hypothetical protein